MALSVLLMNVNENQIFHFRVKSLMMTEQIRILYILLQTLPDRIFVHIKDIRELRDPEVTTKDDLAQRVEKT
jgi:hypothetical protein